MKKQVTFTGGDSDCCRGGRRLLEISGNPDALREIVLEQCLPDQLQHQNPAPCAEVKPRAGYVVFKDRHGPLQYLLMPTYRINGTESPLLLEPATPNFSGWPGRLAAI